MLINKIYLLFFGYFLIIRNISVLLNKGVRSFLVGRDSFDDVKINKKDVIVYWGSFGK